MWNGKRLKSKASGLFKIVLPTVSLSRVHLFESQLQLCFALEPCHWSVKPELAGAWCGVMVGTGFGSGLPVLSTWLYLSARAQCKFQKARPNNSDWWHKGAMGIYSGAFSEGFPNIPLGGLFSNLSPRPNHSVISASAQGVPELLKESHRGRIWTLPPKEWPESGSARNVPFHLYTRNLIRYDWVGAAPRA